MPLLLFRVIFLFIFSPCSLVKADSSSFYDGISIYNENPISSEDVIGDRVSPNISFIIYKAKSRVYSIKRVRDPQVPQLSTLNTSSDIICGPTNPCNSIVIKPGAIVTHNIYLFNTDEDKYIYIKGNQIATNILDNFNNQYGTNFNLNNLPPVSLFLSLPSDLNADWVPNSPMVLEINP